MSLLVAFGCDRSRAVEAGLRRALDAYAGAQNRHFLRSGSYADGDVVQSWPSTIGLVGVRLVVRSASATGHSAVAISGRRSDLACALWASRSDPDGEIVCGAPHEVTAPPEDWQIATTATPETALVAVSEPVVIPGLPRFRARHVQIDPDTVWYTATTDCPAESAAFVRATGAWVRTMRRDCRTRDPVGRGRVWSTDSTPLTRGMWMERAPPGEQRHDILRVPGDTTSYPLLVPDSFRTWARATWDVSEPDDVLPFSRDVRYWLDDGRSLYFGLSADYYFDCPAFGPCDTPPDGATGGLLRFDPTTKTVDAILDRRLWAASVRELFVAGDQLWVAAERSRSADPYRLYRYRADTQSFSTFSDSVGGWLRDVAADGDTVWFATSETVSAFSASDGVWSRRFYRDSLAVLPSGFDTVYTSLSLDRPEPGDTVLGDCPTWGGDDVDDVIRLLACDLDVRRRRAFMTAAARLPDSIPDALVSDCAGFSRSKWVDEYGSSLWECPLTNRPGTVREALVGYLADSSMQSYLHDALPRASTDGYFVALGALTQLGDDMGRAALRAALDSISAYGRTALVMRDLLARGDSTGVWWLRRALRGAPPRDAARMAELVEEVRDPASVDVLIDLIGTADPTGLGTVVRVLVSLTGADSAPPYRRWAVDDSRTRAVVFWQTWWAQHGQGFVPVTPELGTQAVERWRRQ